MKCLNCEYPLWRMKPPGPCPECGAAFDPAQHRFRPGAVHFLCPTCGVAYLGNDADGLPSPRTFTCVKCASACDVSMMAVVPASEAAEAVAVVEKTPWEQRRKIGFFKGFFTTLGWSLAKPTGLGRALSREGGMGQAAWFCGLLTLVTTIGSVGAFVGFALVGAALAGAGAAGGQAGGMAAAGLIGLGLAGALFGPVVSVAVVYPVWALLAHFVLILGSSPRLGLPGTLRCCWYASGPSVVSAVPCFGVYLTPVSLIWSGVSAALMFKAAHRVSGVRAFVAAFIGPVLLLAAVASLFVAAFSGAFFPMPGRGGVTASGPSSVSSALIDAQAADGALPDHVLLGANLDQISAWALDGSLQGRFVLADGTVVSDLGELTEAQREELIAAAGDEPFYLVGDMVFVHRAVNMTTADPELWLAFKDPRVPMPGSPAPTADDTWTSVEVHRADGQEGSVFGSWSEVIEKQNELRQAAGLPLLPESWDDLPVRTAAPPAPRE